MKIDPTKQPAQVVERSLRPARDATRREGSPPTPQKSQTEQLDLSPLTQEIERLQAEIAALPDMRAEKIAELREKIARGEYQIDAAALAERLLEYGVLLTNRMRGDEGEP